MKSKEFKLKNLSLSEMMLEFNSMEDGDLYLMKSNFTLTYPNRLLLVKGYHKIENFALEFSCFDKLPKLESIKFLRLEEIAPKLGEIYLVYYRSFKSPHFMFLATGRGILSSPTIYNGSHFWKIK